MYENSGSQFYRLTTGIQSGSDALFEKWLFMTFLTNLGIKEVLRSFKFVLEVEQVKPYLSHQN